MNGINFIVQTNHDYDTIDPDGRSTAALTKLNGVIQNSGKANSSDIWRILTEKPNFNNLTLMTGVIDVEKGEINHQVWEKSNILWLISPLIFGNLNSAQKLQILLKVF